MLAEGGSAFWLTLAATLAVGWAATVGYGEYRRRRRARRRARYLDGVRFLLDDKPDRALEVFLGLAELDDETVDTHFALGSLYRRRGEVDRAIRVHQHIVGRAGLDPKPQPQRFFSFVASAPSSSPASGRPLITVTPLPLRPLVARPTRTIPSPCGVVGAGCAGLLRRQRQSAIVRPHSGQRRPVPVE